MLIMLVKKTHTIRMKQNLNYLFILLFTLSIFFQTTLAGISGISETSINSDYPNHEQISERLRSISDAHPNYARLESLAQTKGDKNIWLLTIGTGNITNKPALAVVGGISGDHLLGSELAVQFAEKLLARRQEPVIRNLLDSVVFFVFPDMSPDAREQYFRKPRYERLGNANPTDLDRDGRIGEDGYDDLNNDGLITMMRIKDPTGRWIPHPQDERVMVKARTEKGERGQYLLFSEGIDNDKDGQFNEDGEEGVFFNRNFTFKYPAFERGAGEHAVSEIETRAIADFLYDAKNVFAVISFGPANNLTKPLSFNEREANARIFTGWKKEDIAINQKISHLYSQHMGDKAPSAAAGSDGDFFQWAYFHYGRFSFSTHGWEVPRVVEKDEDAFDSDEFNFLRWAEENQIDNVFVPWTKVDHPDFPGRKVEVGGIAPFVMKNPPYAMVDSIAEKHTSFIIDVAALRPQIDIINLKTERLGRNLTRVTLDVINRGTFPTASEAGEQVRWMQKTVMRVTPGPDQAIISGKPVEVMGAIGGRSSEQRSWLIQGSGSVTISVGAEASGFKEVRVNL
ncbi:MAG: peptidase [Bacteroidetes bacterium]|nr:MAG: peptidase [Bacteroidota bacterium]